MHAIVRQGNGQYYISAVFGFFMHDTKIGGYKNVADKINHSYWVVWDPEKKRLIRRPVADHGGIIPQVLAIDTDQSNWIMDEDGIGCVDFLNKELLDSFLDEEEQPEEILKKCRAMDDGYVYDETPEIKTQSDIDNLMWAAGGFHDAFIAKEELQDDGTLYLHFEGTWGCQVDVWLWGDLKYDTSSRDPKLADPYWFGATVILQDGFIYFVDDDDDMTVEKIETGYCYFIARHMRYRIIPE